MVPGWDRDTILDWCRRIDEGPFSSIAAGERIFFSNPEIMVTLSAAAVATERVRIHFDVLVTPMHATLHIAKQIATLDVLSNGRVTLGVGVGGREEDYLALERSFDNKRLRKMEEQIRDMRTAWSGEKTVQSLRPLEPKPIQPGGPPVLVGAITEKSIRRAATWADGLSHFSFGPDYGDIERAFATARNTWSECGRTEAPTLVTAFWYALGDNGREQMDRCLHAYLNFLGPELGPALSSSVATISATTLQDAIAKARDLGTDELLLVPSTIDPDDVDRIADLIA